MILDSHAIICFQPIGMLLVPIPKIELDMNPSQPRFSVQYLSILIKSSYELPEFLLKNVNKNGQSLKICKNLGSLVIVGNEVQRSRKETRAFIKSLKTKPESY